MSRPDRSATCTRVPTSCGTVEGEAPVSRSRKPSVFQVGRVRDDGRTVVISGWGLGLCAAGCACHRHPVAGHLAIAEDQADRKSTRLNSSHANISYAVFCLKKKE